MLTGYELAALRAYFDDDRPRLLIASRLRSEGDPRGEFIEVQCEIARGPSAARRRRLGRRERELLRDFGVGWHDEVGVWESEATFRRGFVEDARLDWWRLWRVHERLAEGAPVRSLRVRGPAEAGAVEALLGLPLAEHLTRLDLAGTGVGDEGAIAIAASPRFARLAALDLRGCGVGDEGVGALAASRHAGSLCQIDLRENDVDDDAARRLVVASRVGVVVRVDGRRFGPAAATRPASAPAATRKRGRGAG